jgi:hypothetical protein
LPVRKKPTRKRPISLRVMVTAAERKELKLAAAKADMPLSALVRSLALAAVRSRTVGSNAQAA